MDPYMLHPLVHGALDFVDNAPTTVAVEARLLTALPDFAAAVYESKDTTLSEVLLRRDAGGVILQVISSIPPNSRRVQDVNFTETASLCRYIMRKWRVQRPEVFVRIANSSSWQRGALWIYAEFSENDIGSIPNGVQKVKKGLAYKFSSIRTPSLENLTMRLTNVPTSWTRGDLITALQGWALLSSIENLTCEAPSARGSDWILKVNLGRPTDQQLVTLANHSPESVYSDPSIAIAATFWTARYWGVNNYWKQDVEGTEETITQGLVRRPEGCVVCGEESHGWDGCIYKDVIDSFVGVDGDDDGHDGGNDKKTGGKGGRKGDTKRDDKPKPPATSDVKQPPASKAKAKPATKKQPAANAEAGPSTAKPVLRKAPVSPAKPGVKRSAAADADVEVEEEQETEDEQEAPKKKKKAAKKAKGKGRDEEAMDEDDGAAT